MAKELSSTMGWGMSPGHHDSIFQWSMLSSSQAGSGAGRRLVCVCVCVRVYVCVCVEHSRLSLRYFFFLGGSVAAGWEGRAYFHHNDYS